MRAVVVAGLAAVAVAVLRHRARWPSRTAQARADGFSEGVVAERMRTELRRFEELAAQAPGYWMPTLEELRAGRGWISGPMAPVPLEDSVEWWERNWPDADRLEDEQDGEANR